MSDARFSRYYLMKLYKMYKEFTHIFSDVQHNKPIYFMFKK